MKLGYVILYVPDVAAAVAFYERAFALTRRFIHDSGQYAEMETGGTALGFVAEDLAAQSGHGFRANRPNESPAGAEVAFVADDVEVAYSAALKAGATPWSAPETKPWGQVVSYVRDLNGFLVEICSAIL